MLEEYQLNKKRFSLRSLVLHLSHTYSVLTIQNFGECGMIKAFCEQARMGCNAGVFFLPFFEVWHKTHFISMTKDLCYLILN